MDRARTWIKGNPTNAAFAALAVVTTAVLLVLLARGKLDGEGAAALIVVVLICAYLSLAGREMAVDRAMAWIKENPTNAAFAGLALGTTAVVVVLLARGKLDGAGAAALIVVVIICALLSVAGRELIDRIVKLGPVEFSPPADLPGPESAPNMPPGTRADAPEKRVASPWTRMRVTAEQQWQYEQATIMLVRLRQQGQLQSDGQVEKFRGLILDTGEAALNEQQFAKGLDILKLLEPMREKTANELLSLGTAHLWMIDEEYIVDGRREEYLKRALRYLQEATRSDTTSAIAFWTLGYVNDEIGRHRPAIDAKQEAIRLDLTFLPWANWHIAISLLKLAKQHQAWDEVELAGARADEAMQKITQIPPGPWWQELFEDDELGELQENPNHRAEFQRLYESRA